MHWCCLQAAGVTSEGRTEGGQEGPVLSPITELRRVFSFVCLSLLFTGFGLKVLFEKHFVLQHSSPNKYIKYICGFFALGHST